MRKVRVNASSSYDILIGKGLLERCGKLCLDAIPICRLCIVTDDTVAALYLERAEQALRSAGYTTVSFVFPHGEQSKNADTLVSLLEFAAENGLTRSDAFIALGGGVVGDMCGFAAATYMRGVRFVQIPTTLLAATDSSVGGKTGVDLMAGKNLFGAFHQPSLVICDTDTLSTLPPDIFADGCAEVIKYGVIDDRDFFIQLGVGIREQLEWVIEKCVTSKKNIVEQDEFESGRRALLNLGHTVGHAIEVCSGFNISHGSAVAIGMVIVMRSAVCEGICPAGELEMLISMLKSAALPTECGFTSCELAAVALSDKKRRGDSITMVVPHSIGDTRLEKIPAASLEDFISKGLC